MNKIFLVIMLAMASLGFVSTAISATPPLVFDAEIAFEAQEVSLRSGDIPAAHIIRFRNGNVPEICQGGGYIMADQSALIDSAREAANNRIVATLYTNTKPENAYYYGANWKNTSPCQIVAITSPAKCYSIINISDMEMSDKKVVFSCANPTLRCMFNEIEKECDVKIDGATAWFKGMKPITAIEGFHTVECNSPAR